MRHLSLALPVCLIACTEIPPATAARLAALSPMEADPAALSVAVAAPPGLRPVPGSAKLILTARRSDTGATETLALTLRESPASSVAPVEDATIFSIAPADLAPMRHLQSRLHDWKATAPDATHGSLSVGIAACATGNGPVSDATASVWLRTDPKDDWMPLIREAPLADLIGADTLATIQPCKGPSAR
jgi:hypothetical protein